MKFLKESLSAKFILGCAIFAIAWPTLVIRLLEKKIRIDAEILIQIFTLLFICCVILLSSWFISKLKYLPLKIIVAIPIFLLALFIFMRIGVDSLRLIREKPAADDVISGSTRLYRSYWTEADTEVSYWYPVREINVAGIFHKIEHITCSEWPKDSPLIVIKNSEKIECNTLPPGSPYY